MIFFFYLRFFVRFVAEISANFPSSSAFPPNMGKILVSDIRSTEGPAKKNNKICTKENFGQKVV